MKTGEEDGSTFLWAVRSILVNDNWTCKFCLLLLSLPGHQGNYPLKWEKTTQNSVQKGAACKNLMWGPWCWKRKKGSNRSKTESMWWAQSINKATKSTTSSNRIRWRLCVSPNNTYECCICPWHNGKASTMKASHAKEHILSAVHQWFSKAASEGSSRLSRMVEPTPISSDVLDDDVQQPLPTRPVRTILLFLISSFTSVNSLW